MRFNYAAVCKLCCVFFHCFIVVYSINIPQFICSTVDGYFSLQFGVFTNNIDVNIFSYVSYPCVGISVKCIPRSEIAKSQDMHILALVDNVKQFSKEVVPAETSTNSLRIPVAPHPCQPLVLFCSILAILAYL